MSHSIKIPSVGESITSATVATWHKNDGDYVRSGEVILTFDTDKISQELEADRAGLLKHGAAEGDELEIGAVVATIEEGEAPEESDEGGSDDAKEGASSGEGGEKKQEDADSGREVAGKQEKNGEQVKATPVARKIAADEGIDLTKLSGTGAGGKVTKADVLEASESRDDDEVVSSKEGDEIVPSPEGKEDPAPRTTRRKMSSLRRKIATHLVNAQQEAAILTTFNECDMTRILSLRKSVQEDFVSRNDVKLGFMSFFIKAVVDGLKTVPSLNARMEGDEIVENHFYDIGVAVGTEKGLVVPVIRDCDRKTFAEIEQDIVAYATKAREGSLGLADLQGGVFTITNGGIYGSLLSTPILNPPQSGILGMHSIQERPVAWNGEVVIRPMMYLALSYDHRIVDGKEAVTFLVRAKDCLENPDRMLVGA